MKRTAATEKTPANMPVSGQTGVDQALIKSELRFRRLFESAQDGILILNAETGLINDVNPYLIYMLGYSREEFVEKKLWEVGAFRDIECSCIFACNQKRGHPWLKKRKRISHYKTKQPQRSLKAL